MTKQNYTPNDKTVEEWQDIPEYEGLYQASNLGRIRSCPRLDSLGRKVGRVLKQIQKPNGYFTVTLHKNNNQKSEYVHRIVALVFLGEPGNFEVNHINSDKSDNGPSNLEYVTHRQNILHSRRVGTHPIGSNHGMSKINSETVEKIKAMKKRGVLQKDIATMLNLSEGHVSNIINRKPGAWDWLE